MRLVSRWFRLDLSDWSLLLEAALMLAWAALRVRFLPFQRLVMARAPRHTLSATSADLRRLCWSVEALSRRVPFRSKCLEQALALRAMLYRRGVASIIHYGIRNCGRSGLAAHAWLSVDNRVIIGANSAAHFAQVATFGDMS
jgi:hypothetical protein